MRQIIAILWLCCLGIHMNAFAAVSDVNTEGATPLALSPLFSDGAVLQQGMPVPVWGTAPTGQELRVSLQGQEFHTVARNGRWMVTFRPLRAGGPFVLGVTGEHTLQHRVWVGEVWICSGQSNMEMPVSESEHAPDLLTSDPNLALYTIPKPTMTGPVPALAASWRTSDRASIGSFSAVGYFFARKAREALGVPVGMINVSFGGSNIALWVDAGTQSRIAGSGSHANGRLYDAMIRPLCPYAIRGVLWYQGESDADRSILYRSYFPALIELWRKDWGQGDFPFLFVQLPGFNFYKRELPSAPRELATWAEIREVQSRTASSVPNAAMVVTTDLGDPVFLHCSRKREIGERLAMTALGQVYGEKVACKYPLFERMTIEGGTVRVAFANAEDGLVIRGDKPTGFALCGNDRIFRVASGSVDGDTVILSSPEVANPIAVRYGWDNYPQLNLFSQAGLPASPFRTDDVPLLKCPKCQSRGGDEINKGICVKCNVLCGAYSEHPFAIAKP